MANIQRINSQAELALAAYANLAGGSLIGQDAELKKAGFAIPQINSFASRYTVVLPTYHDAVSDLDVTVFKDAGGNLTLGIRGTLEAHDLAVTDGLIAVNGAAYDQIVALYNWWQRVSTPAGQAVAQYQLQTYSMLSAPANAVQLYVNPLSPTIATYLVPATSVAASGDLVDALATDPDHKIDVTGHSLGGHLALAFNTLFPGVTGQVIGFDSPGFIDNTVNQQFFAELGGSVPTNANSGNVINVIADETNIGDKPFNAIAGLYSRPGTLVDISIENQWLSDEPVPETAKNHSMKMLTDSLAVYSLLNDLAPNLTTTTYKALLNQAAVGTAASYERIVDGLETVLGVNTALLPVGNDQRDALYTAIYGLQANATFTALQGKIQLVMPPVDGLTAKTDFSALLSLVYLTPFALQPVDATAFTTLKNAQPMLAAQWDADQALTEVERAQGQANFSDLYLKDRAAMLTWKTKIAGDDLPNDLAPYYSDTYYFKDEESGTQVWLDNPLYFNPAANEARIQILFGGTDADILAGGNRADHLYGNLGNDMLSGGGGNDYLEGGQGSDTLQGEAGHDTLIGGTGADSLEGGAQSDRLEGGQGADTYIIRAADGNDILEDSDGVGTIQVEIDNTLVTLDGGKKDPSVEGRWISDDQKVVYTFVPDASGIGTMTIQWGTQALVVHNYQLGQLGLTIADKDPVTLPAYPNTRILADDNPGNDPIGVEADFTSAAPSWDISGTLNNDSITGSLGDDRIAGGGGIDQLYGNDGNDRLYADDVTDVATAIAAARQTQAATAAGVMEGGRGDDLLVGGVSNYLYGGAARDTLIGGGGADIVEGDAFNGGYRKPDEVAQIHLDYDAVKHSYTYYVSNTVDGTTTNYTDFADLDVDGKADVIVTGGGNDFADGQLGDDYLSLGDGNDIGVGRDGADVIYGGNDDDTIFGDFNWDEYGLTPTADQPINYAGLAGQYHGNDILSGGDGNDYIQGNGRDDEIYGDTGNDTILGDDEITPGAYHGKDYIEGGTGDDKLSGNGDDDALYGDEGDDELSGDDGKTPGQYHGNDVLDGGDGSDTLWGDGNDDVLSGGIGNDYLEGDYSTLEGQYHGNDYLDGGDGADTLVGDGGDDELWGGAGDDKLTGDNASNAQLDNQYLGSDTLYGEDGNDFLEGGGKGDWLLGGAGDDVLYGDGAVVPKEAHGDDYLDGGEGNDSLSGDGGNDVLVGGAGTDGLFGGDGNDTLDGGADADYLQGGAGDDTYLFNLGDAPVLGGVYETIDDTEGANAVQFGAGIAQDGLSVNLDVSGQYLVLGYGSSDSVIIEDGFHSAVREYRFENGSSLSWAELIGHYYNTQVNASYTQAGIFAAGGTEDDVLTATGGGATVSGGRGNDTLAGAGGGNTYLYGLGDGSDSISDTGGGTTPNRLKFGPGIASSQIKLGLGSLAIQVGSDPNDVVHIENFNPDDVYGNRAIDLFEFADGTVLTYEELLARGFDLVGGAGDDSIVGTNVADRIDGGGGNDTLVGGEGNDVYLFGPGSGQDVIDNTDAGAGHSDTLLLGADIAPTDITLQQSADNLIVSINGTTDQVTILDHFLSAPINRIQFADGTVWDQAEIGNHLTSALTTGNDTFTGTGANDIILALDGNDTVYGMDGDDTIDGGIGTDVLRGGNGDDMLLGNEGGDSLYGDAGNDVLDGGAGGDVLYGGVGDDVLDGGAGNDNLYGGAGYSNVAGNDTYLFGWGSGWDTIVDFDLTEGNVDTVQMGAGVLPTDVAVRRDQFNNLWLALGGGDDTLNITYGFGNDGYKVERVVFADGTVWDTDVLVAKAMVGTADADYLVGTSGDDVINGLEGNDRINGAAGNDVLDGAAGNDTAYGGAGSDQLRGGDGSDMLNGDDGDDTLDGGTGNDYLNGGLGSDTYVFERGTGFDTIYENQIDAASNIDRIQMGPGIKPSDIVVSRTYPPNDLLLHIQSTSDYLDISNFFARQDDQYKVERFVFEDGTTWDIATIKAILDTATNGNDNLQGYDWADTIDGLGGDDTIFGYSGNDQLFGSAGNDQLYGGLGDDALDGGADADHLFGEEGNDTLEGGTGNDVLYGDKTYMGVIGDDILHGGAGNDVLCGGEGNDTYLFGRGDGSDVVREWGGSDRILLAEGVLPADVTLFRVGDDLFLALDKGATQLKVFGFFGSTGAQVENIEFANGVVWDLPTIQATAVVGTPDAMIGTAGDDTFIVDHVADTVTEGVDQGIDTVQSSVSYTIGANIENLTLTGYLNINGTGNDLDNTIIGNIGNNVLDGKGGHNTLKGGAGDDTYYIRPSKGDTAIELAGEGVDTVYADFSYTLPDNIENLSVADLGFGNSIYSTYLTGNALDNVIDGSGGYYYRGDTRIDGGPGADVMIGQANVADTFYVDNPGDVVLGGNMAGDLVYSSVSYTLSSRVEDLTLMGSSALSGTGNALNNVLTGNGANNVLDGAAGDDIMAGGAGDDTYIVDNAGDKITENADEGTDSVQSSISYTLGANLENLALTGASAINGTDNTLNNLVIGNSADNTLSAGTGNDILQGGSGNDTLSDAAGSNLLDGGSGDDSLAGDAGDDLLEGGTGNDTLATGTGYDIIAINRGDGQDVLAASTGTDNTISLGGGIRNGDLSFRKSANDLILDTGAGEQVTLQNWYASTSYHSVASLQMIEEAAADFDAASGDPLRDNKVERFDFQGLASRFDAALAADPALTSWSLTNALLDFHLGGSDSEALGGDLAYEYGKNGTLAGIGVSAAQSIQGDSRFGQSAQAIQQPGLKEGLVTLG